MAHIVGHVDEDEEESLDDFLRCLFDPECADNLTSNLDGDTAVDRTSSSATDTFTRETVDEITNQIRSVFFAVPTPEEFLDDFGNAFAGFAANAADAGLAGGDLAQLQDPASGFMQKMLGEFMGEIAQRAAKGDEVFELAGLGGETKKVGDRPGQRIETESERKTRIESEASGGGSSTTVTTPVGEEAEGAAAGGADGTSRAEQEATTRTVKESTSDVTDRTVESDSSRVFEETEQIFQRPSITPVLRFTPSDFLLQRFASETAEGASPEEKRERFLGKLSTELRTSAPKVRPRGGSTSISARRT